MDKTTIMALGTLVKFVIGLGGILSTLIILTIGIARKDNDKVKRAGLIFAGTWVLLLVLAGIEFVILSNV